MTLYPTLSADITTASTDGKPFSGVSLTALKNDKFLLLYEQNVGSQKGITGPVSAFWYAMSGGSPTSAGNNSITVRTRNTTNNALVQVAVTFEAPQILTGTVSTWRVAYSAVISNQGFSPQSPITFNLNGTDYNVDITGIRQPVNSTGSVISGHIDLTTTPGQSSYTFTAVGISDYSGSAESTNAIQFTFDIGDVPVWQSVARVGTLSAGGWTLGAPTTFAWAGSECARATAVTEAGNVVLMTGRSVRGYSLAEIDYDQDTVVVHDPVPVMPPQGSGPEFGVGFNVRTRMGHRGAKLAGSDTFIFMRRSDGGEYVELVKLAGTSLTIPYAGFVAEPNTSTDGWGTVIATGATTAIACQSYAGGGGHPAAQLRFWQFAVVNDQISQGFLPFNYPSEIVVPRQNWTEMYPAPEGADHVSEIILPSTDGTQLKRYAIGITTSFPYMSWTEKPLAQLDTAARPDGVPASGTTLVTNGAPVAYVAAGTSLYVARSMYIDPTDATRGGRTMITEYSLDTGEILSTTWDQAPNAVDGWGVMDLSGIYDASSGSVLFAGTDVWTTRPKTQYRYAIGDWPTGDVRLMGFSLTAGLIDDLADGGYVQSTRFN